MKTNYVFVKMVPAQMITELSDGKNVAVSIPGSMRFTAPAGSIFPSADMNGNPIAKHFNVRFPAGSDVDVTMTGDDGNVKRETRKAEQVVRAWNASQREYADAMGAKTWINGISAKLVRESKVAMKDGRTMLSVSVADPESMPTEGRTTGYGSFLVSPDAVTPCKTDGKLNIYLGRANAKVSGYQIRTGENVFEKIARTAAEIKANFEADIAAFKAAATA